MVLHMVIVVAIFYRTFTIYIVCPSFFPAVRIIPLGVREDMVIRIVVSRNIGNVHSLCILIVMVILGASLVVVVKVAVLLVRLLSCVHHLIVCIM